MYQERKTERHGEEEGGRKVGKEGLWERNGG